MTGSEQAGRAPLAPTGASAPSAAPAPGGSLDWPGRSWALLLGLLVLLETATHLGFRSPYLYQTRGHYELEQGSYGMSLGPRGEIIHFDAVNYWPAEQLFGGRLREGRPGSISRPTYPLLASLLDNYLHPVYAGWIVNVLAWWAAALCAYALARGLGGGPAEAKAFSVLVATAPGFISMAGQPMGYVLGYALHIIFLACLAGWLPAAGRAAAAAAGGLAFLLIAADLTYEILGALCLVPFLARARRGLPWPLTAGCAAAMAAAKLVWDAFVIRGVFGPEAGSGLETRAGVLAGTGAAPLTAVPEALGHLAWGSLIGGFVLVPLAGWIALAALPSAPRRFLLWGILAVTLPLLYMGVLGETTGDYRFYKEGRLVAYYFPFLALAACLGLPALAARLGLRGRAPGALLAGLAGLHVALANADWVGVQALYHVLHRRPGYTLDALLGL